MSTIYIPHIIESQEEVDALPDGTVAIRDGSWPRILLRDETGQHWASWEAVGMTRPDMRGWTALVPTDADEYDSEEMAPGRHRSPDIYSTTEFTLWLTDEEEGAA